MINENHMLTAQRILPKLYRDSVALMQLSTRLANQPGIDQAYVMMATPGNLEMLSASGLAADAAPVDPNDLIIVVQGQDAENLTATLNMAEELLLRRAESGDGGEVRTLSMRSIQMGLGALPTANLALISTPGEYAAAEAYKALRLGLNVMIFSDNVSLEDEVALKRLAQASGLLVMGPDCGTAIVDGVPLAFANVVRRGRIGVIGASGTGIQQITCLIDRLGGGVSHALGTGGRDLYSAVGGISMRTALADLSVDDGTDVIVLVSKPPAAEVADQILTSAAQIGKPVVVNFLGAPPTLHRSPLYFAETLADASQMAVALATGTDPTTDGGKSGVDQQQLTAIASHFSPTQRHVRGLYSGGTFCYEALLILEKSLGPIHSNLAKDPALRLHGGDTSRGHTVIDLGDDEFTRGRPHPMIDQRLRAARILSEAADDSVAVLLLDVVLGYGAHEDPATALTSAIVQAREIAAHGGRSLAVVGFVCGTAGDPQQLARQEGILTEAGVCLAESSSAAARMAAALVANLPHDLTPGR